MVIISSIYYKYILRFLEYKYNRGGIRNSSVLGPDSKKNNIFLLGDTTNHVTANK